MALIALLLVACAPQRDCATTLWWVGEAQSVSVVGDWNDWRPGVDPLQPHRGAFRGTFDLPVGDHDYQLLVDGVRRDDPFAPLEGERQGEAVSRLRVEDCSVPALRLLSAAADPSGNVRLRAIFEAVGPALDRATSDLPGASITLSPARGELELAAQGLPPGKHTLHLSAWDRDGGLATLTVPLWVEDHRPVWEGGLLYAIMVDRFADADGQALAAPPSPTDRAGGRWEGVTAAIESGYFARLGVTALWLGPILENPDGRWESRDGHLSTSYHGYWPRSATELEPRLGGEPALRALIATAHDHGLRVIIDVVPNHVHAEHPYAAEPGWVNEGCVCGAEDCPWETELESCWFADYLPDLNHSDSDVRAAVMADIVALALDLDVDGLRVDAAPMMPRSAIRELRYRLDAAVAGPHPLFSVGETFTGPGGWAEIRSRLGPHGLHGQFDFPVMWALRDFLAGGSGTAEDLAQALTTSATAWAGSGAVMAPFVGNHDVARFVSVANGEGDQDPWTDPPPAPTSREPYVSLALAQAIALTLPGLPTLYMGDEYGAAGANDPDNRRPMRFVDRSEPEQWLWGLTATLGRARACSPALAGGDWTVALAMGDLYAHRRATADDEALLIVNRGLQPARVRLPLGRATHDVLAPDAPLGEEIAMPPRSARLLLNPALPCVSDLNGETR
jgi:glycosidase